MTFPEVWSKRLQVIRVMVAMPLLSRAHRQAGQGMVEYAFILILIALVVLVMLITTGKQVTNLYSDITTALKNPAGL